MKPNPNSSHASLANGDRPAHAACGAGQPARADTPAWTPTTWRGEQAYELTAASWRAVVSVERGRLVHFGPADTGRNLLFETASRQDPFSWGGHRVWLGPQALWGWPPPDAWERAAAENVEVNGSRLALLMPDAGSGFPRLTRIYEVSGSRLACRVAIAGGTQAVQVMQILQTPQATTVDLTPAPSAQWPRGYFRVGGDIGPSMEPVFLLPAGVQERPGHVHIAFAGKSDKFAFPPQALAAHTGGRTLLLAFGESRGTELDAPDGGFYTQVYIGHAEAPVVELEQLSPQWKAGEDAEFTMYVELAPLAAPKE
jgi:hypothetical protein